ncbi:MAG: citramalate synthase [Coriobacteriaceae bacterium]|nr:citramalate synthase [Coriobacteriaceae bacterium]
MIRLYDTTLRDGEQREGVSLTVEDKLSIARRLDTLGVSYIEGGFPVSNPKDAAFFVRAGELNLKQAQLVAFGLSCKKGTAAAEDAGLNILAACSAPIITLLGKAWDIQVEQVLATNRDENLRMIEDSVRFLVDKRKEVFLDAEHFFDGYRSDAAYALAVLEAGIRGGATAVVLCETNGGALPNEVFDITLAVSAALRDNGHGDVEIGIHTHDDSGCAVANSLEAVRAGATQVQGTVNGYGERVGNANLLTVLADLELKMGYEVVGGERLKLLTSTSQFVAETLNITPDPHQPYVGQSAFAHKGGLHVSAHDRLLHAYEHVDPVAVGNFAHIVVSELAGKVSLRTKASEFGITLPEQPEAIDRLLDNLKQREAKGYSYEVADASLALLLRAQLGEPITCFKLESFRVIADKREDGKLMTEATIKIHVGDERFVATGEGNGPVNALDVALRLAIRRFYPQIDELHLTDYKVRVIDESTGTSAITRVLIETSDGFETWGTVGVSENIIEASWNALVDAISYGLLRWNRDVSQVNT